MLGLDYSAGRPGGAAIKAAGYDFVIRYCGQPNNPKCATRAEVADLLAHGVAVALVFESYASRASEGFAAGVADAQAAVAHQAALGIPASRPIYYAVDYDADPTVVEPYFRGVASVAGPDAAYGSYRVVQRLQADGLAGDVWQTVAWSRGQLLPSRDVFQRLGTVTVGDVACDVNESNAADFGQYPVEDDVSWTDPLTADDGEVAPAAKWLTNANKFVQQLPAKLLATQLPNPLYDEKITDPADMRSHQSYTFQDWLVWSNLKSAEATAAANQANATALAALGALKTVALAQGTDPEALITAVEKGVNDALANWHPVITVNPAGA